jgi:hypothetical protein
MSIKSKLLLIITMISIAYFGRAYWLETYTYGNNSEARQDKAGFNISPRESVLAGEKFETVHYLISSTATPEQTTLVSNAVESLYKTYGEFFKEFIPKNSATKKLNLMLYRNRQEFSANNKSSSWAEAYYREPVCYAYYSDDQPNPHHWMIHEATHQLNKELAHFTIPKWVNEGLATYFGTSKIENGLLLPGNIDKNTYPIWWLASLDLSGSLQTDIGKGKIIPLRTIITGKDAPDISKNVNLYYIEYWSFTHFLFHYKNGLYANSYKQLITEGGSLENFEKIIGPLNQVENEWYWYLQQKIIEANESVETELDDAVEVSL